MGYSWYNGHAPKLRAESFQWLKAELAAGRIPPPSRCQACEETRGHLDYHTEDYSRPFGPHIHQHELCFRCHMVLHARHRAPTLWQRYINRLECGAVYQPLMSRAEIGRIWEPGWVDSPVGRVEPRGRLDFFRGLAIGRHVTSPPDDRPRLFDQAAPE